MRIVTVGYFARVAIFVVQAAKTVKPMVSDDFRVDVMRCPCDRYLYKILTLSVSLSVSI